MTDPTNPLLPNQRSGRLKSLALTSSIEDMIELCIGPSGIAQLLQAFIVSLACFFDAQQTFINVFTDANPAWHCTNASDESCSSARSPCGLSKGSWAWDQPMHTSIVSEWELQCASPSVLGLPTSSYFLGCVAGGLILATLADSWLGRKKTLFISCLSMSVAAALSVASPNIWAYSCLRFACGFGRATIGTSALVLSTEIVGRKWRDRVANFNYFSFTFGFICLPAIAYLGRGFSWRNLYLWTSIPSFCYTILIYFMIKESPRWLLIRGRRDEAIATLKSIAKSNGNDITCSFLDPSMVEESRDIMDLYSALKILWQTKWAFRRLVVVMTVSFGIGIIYYGMPLNLGNLLSSDLYINVALNALSELPSCLITFFLIGKLDRRTCTIVLTAVSGICSLSCVFLQDSSRLQVAVEVVSFFSNCTALNLFFIYCIELFPTCVRNSAIAMVREVLVLGGVFAPVLVTAGRRRTWLSFGVFGLLVGCCGLFAACLPETRGKGISDTMEEEECKMFDCVS